jgi:transposase
MGELRMSSKERIRLEALRRVTRAELTVAAAAELMGLSLRQARRVWRRFNSDGDAGLVHRHRGRASNRRSNEDLRERVVKRHQDRYADFGPTLACEKLAEEGLAISPNTLTALLKARGLWERRRRRGKHRKRRERRACFGSMVQMDGSHHDWFEGRAPKCVLMVLIDDATSRTYARFYRAETTEAAFDALGRWVKRHGLPRALYVDRHSIYRDEDHPEKPTQFCRAAKQLQTEVICAHSPQAKGRVERMNGTLQDRLVKEMRLRGINSIGQGNTYLESKFLDEFNGRYAVKATRDQDVHRAVEVDVVLEEVLCVHEQRVVGNDWCVRWRNRWLQIAAEHASLRLAGRRVLVKQLADGRLLVQHDGRTLTVQELRARPAPTKRKKPVIVNNRRWKPPSDHPWNRPPADRPAPRASPSPAAPARDLHAEKKRKAG